MNKINSINRISRDDAVEIVGKGLFGTAWIGELTNEEWELIRKYKFQNGKRPPVPVDVADKLYHADERDARSDRQRREVHLWLENRGLDCVRGLNEGFDRGLFAQEVAKGFGMVLPSLVGTKYRHAGDARLVQDALNALKENKASNSYQAAKLVCDRGDPNYDQTVDRLRKLIAKALKSDPTAKDRQS